MADHADIKLVLAHWFVAMGGNKAGSFAVYPEDLESLWQKLRELPPTVVGIKPLPEFAEHGELHIELWKALEAYSTATFAPAMRATIEKIYGIKLP